MFTSGMRETHEGEVVIPNVRLPIFRTLLEYIYADRYVCLTVGTDDVLLGNSNALLLQNLPGWR